MSGSRSNVAASYFRRASVRDRFGNLLPLFDHGIRVPALVISPYAKSGFVDHQILSFDSYLKFIEDDFLDGERLDPKTDGRPDPRPSVREAASILGDLRQDFDFSQEPRAPLLLPERPHTTLITSKSIR